MLFTLTKVIINNSNYNNADNSNCENVEKTNSHMLLTEM